MNSFHIAAGTPVLVGDKLVPMPELRPGERVLAVPRNGTLVVIGAEGERAAAEAVADAEKAFGVVAHAPAGQVTAFFDGFADKLADEAIWGRIAEANRRDLERAKALGRHTGRLAVSAKMRSQMIDGLRGWARTGTRTGEVIERRVASGCTFERRRAPLGVVGFVFEGRPNVFADGTGVVRNGNTCVMRIGGDALDTAVAIEKEALAPALAEAKLPESTVRLVRSRSHDAAQALFTQRGVRLAVARGSGATVSLLGSIAEQHGIPVSLHGTGGAWMYVDESASPTRVRNAVTHSLDRKVCNTLNVLVLGRKAAESLSPEIARALADRRAKVHVCQGSEGWITGVDVIEEERLSVEWEWDDVPELSVVVCDGQDEAVALINRYSPRFVASILTSSDAAFEDFFRRVDAPYVGNGFTRWVDGQWAWNRPELGLTNWERGRLLGRSGFLSGEDIFTVRDLFFDQTAEATQSR